MLRLIEDVLEADVTFGCPKSRRYLPAIPLKLRFTRTKDAWAVFMGRAEAVQWPHHKETPQ